MNISDLSGKTENSKIFVDTAPIIYYLEHNAGYYSRIVGFFTACYENDVLLLTSALTVEEYCAYPFIQNRPDLITNFKSFLRDYRFEIADIDTDTAYKAAELRGRYPYFKAFDSVQLSAAIRCGADIFVTNDRQLRQCGEITVTLVDEMA